MRTLLTLMKIGGKSRPGSGFQHYVFDTLVPTLKTFFSDVDSLRNGIIRTSRNNAKAMYTIVLVGESGVGKTSVVEFIANVLAGNDLDHYILDHTNRKGDSANQSQTSEARLYELASKNDVVVSSGLLDVASRHNIFPRFAYSTSRDWSIIEIFNKPSSTRRALQLKFRSTSTMPLPF